MIDEFHIKFWSFEKEKENYEEARHCLNNNAMQKSFPLIT